MPAPANPMQVVVLLPMMEMVFINHWIMGDTWTHVGLDSIGATGRIVVHPADPNICYVGAMGFLFENNPDRGVFKTQNGGLSWQRVLFINDSTGVIDLVMDPSNPEILYAAAWQRVRRIDFQQYGGPASGIYKSVNGGMSWQKISDSFLGDAGRIGLAISASDPNIVVAAVCNPSGGLQGIYKTIDAGENWNPLDISGIAAPSYSYWFGRIFIHPQDPDVMYYTDSLCTNPAMGVAYGRKLFMMPILTNIRFVSILSILKLY
jgi:hypothetical protein